MKKILFLALMFTASLTAFADDLLNPITTGVPSLLINPDAAAGGMGDVGVATNSDMNSQYWNSSKYALNESSAGFAFSYTPWLRKLGVSDIDLAYLAGFYNFGDMAGTLSASLRYFSLGEVTLRQSSADIPYSVNPYEMAFDLGYSRKLSEYFSMGVVMRFIASDLSAKTDANYYTGYGFSADVNGYYSLPIEMSTGISKFMAGFNLSNIGTKITYDKGDNYNFLPLNLRLGVSYQLPFDDYNRILISAEANKTMVPTVYSTYAENYDPEDESTWALTDDEYNNISVFQGLAMSWNDAPGGISEELSEINWAAGLEYAYNEQFFARFGYSHEAYNKGNRKYCTAGAGFKLSAFKLDVGYVIALTTSNPLDQTLRFTLSFDVDGIMELADRK
ncbi:MAG: type IX secretion system outer membrane channel protein PorV [bacterium]